LQSTFDIRLALTYLREFITVLLAHNSGSQQDTTRVTTGQLLVAVGDYDWLVSHKRHAHRQQAKFSAKSLSRHPVSYTFVHAWYGGGSYIRTVLYSRLPHTPSSLQLHLKYPWLAPSIACPFCYSTLVPSTTPRSTPYRPVGCSLSIISVSHEPSSTWLLRCNPRSQT